VAFVPRIFTYFQMGSNRLDAAEQALVHHVAVIFELCREEILKNEVLDNREPNEWALFAACLLRVESPAARDAALAGQNATATGAERLHRMQVTGRRGLLDLVQAHF